MRCGTPCRVLPRAWLSLTCRSASFSRYVGPLYLSICRVTTTVLFRGKVVWIVVDVDLNAHERLDHQIDFDLMI